MSTVNILSEGVTVEKDGKTWLVNADSIVTLAELADKPYRRNTEKWNEIARRNKSPIGRETDWWGVANAEENRRIIASGMWPEGVKRMQAALDTLATPLPVSVRRAPRWSDQGDELDIHRVNNGQLDSAWRRSGPRRRTGNRSVTIMANVSINAGTSSEVLFWKGAAAMKLADVLTTAGYSVEVAAAFATKGMDRSYCQNACLTTVIKPARAPLDLNALAVSICLAGFFRHVMFKALLAIPTDVNSGLGHSERYRDVVSTEMDPRQLIECEGISDARQANVWISKQIAMLESNEQEAA